MEGTSISIKDLGNIDLIKVFLVFFCFFAFGYSIFLSLNDSNILNKYFEVNYHVIIASIVISMISAFPFMVLFLLFVQKIRETKKKKFDIYKEYSLTLVVTTYILVFILLFYNILPYLNNSLFPKDNNLFRFVVVYFMYLIFFAVGLAVKERRLKKKNR